MSCDRCGSSLPWLVLDQKSADDLSSIAQEWIGKRICVACHEVFERYGKPLQARSLFPHGSAARKAIPIVSGVLNYFPAALAEVAKVSKKGNDKHNPGLPLQHARGKSTDHADSAVRHIMEFEADHSTLDPDSGLTVLAHAAWRVLALLQEHLEAQGAPIAPAARFPEKEK